MIFFSKKKAQITTFIILGIIVLLVFVFLYYVTKDAQDMQTQKLESIQSKFNTQAFKLYVDSCLQRAVIKGVEKISLQGGYLNPGPDSVIQGRNKIPYLIEANPNIMPPPNYPCTSNCKYEFDPNRPCNPNIPSLVGKTCPLLLSPPAGKMNLLSLRNSQDSIKTQLESYISNELNNCVDFDAIVGIISSPFSVSQGETTIRLNINSNNIQILATLPLEIISPDIGAELQEKEFELTLPIRYAQLYPFIQELIYRDSSDLSFDIASDFVDLTNYIPGFNITIIRNYQGTSDLVIVRDDSSLLDGSPLRFQFMRQNLNPSLNYIHYNEDDEFDIAASENEQVKILLKAFDPNEDDLTYSISGWGGASIANNTLRIDTAETGIHEITVRVNDGQLEDYQEVKIRIS